MLELLVIYMYIFTCSHKCVIFYQHVLLQQQVPCSMTHYVRYRAVSVFHSEITRQFCLEQGDHHPRASCCSALFQSSSLMLRCWFWCHKSQELNSGAATKFVSPSPNWKHVSSACGLWPWSFVTWADLPQWMVEGTIHAATPWPWSVPIYTCYNTTISGE